MQIVIDISKELYEANRRGLEAGELLDLRLAVKNGKLLPKGHGRLIDENRIKNAVGILSNITPKLTHQQS